MRDRFYSDTNFQGDGPACISFEIFSRDYFEKGYVYVYSVLAGFCLGELLKKFGLFNDFKLYFCNPDVSEARPSKTGRAKGID